MDGIILLITLASVAVPVLLTYLYRRTLSPAIKHKDFSSLPTGYKALLYICAFLPIAGALMIDSIENVLDIDELWFVLFPAAIILSVITIDGVLIWARRSKWLLLLALPYVAISAISTALIIYMLIMILDPHPRMF